MQNPFRNFQNYDPKTKKLLFWFIVGLILITVFAVAILAWKISEASNSTTVISSQTTSTWSLAFNMIWRLTLVIGLIYFIFYIFRGWQSKKINSGEKRLAVKETIRLSPRQAIHIIRVGKKEYLIGASDQSLNLLAEISDGQAPQGEQVNEQSSLEGQESNPQQNFESFLQQSIKATFDQVVKPQKDN